MNGGAATDEVRRALADAVAAERLRIVASLIRTTGDWDLAEDAVADATERALRRWPRDGVPTNPAAWLTTTARRRAIDLVRRAGLERTKLAEVAALKEPAVSVQDPTWPVTDDRLRLIFTCCHPALSLESRVALTLKVVADLSTAAIARAFLTTEATMGRRLLRAKRRIAHAGIPFRVPTGDALDERLDGVLAVVYLIFTEGYASPGDHDRLAPEAVRLGRLLVSLLPASDEARGLLALMLLQGSRARARLVDGELVTLERQDRARWDRDAIAEALALGALGGERGGYRIQAELAAAHATATHADDTDWGLIVSLYDELLALHPSSVVSLNRAIAVGMRDGPEAGLGLLDELGPSLGDHHLFAAARGELLARAGRAAQAAVVLAHAAERAPTDAERRHLSRRAHDLARPGTTWQ